MKKLIAVLILVTGSLLNAQQEVTSKAYSLMLKSLLSHSVPEISVISAIANSGTSTTWLDTRENNETMVSSIKNSLHVGYEDFTISSIDSIPKDSEIIVYCSVGYRSEKIAERLIKAGFSNVKNLYGGIFEWVNQGQATYRDNQITPEIHGYNKIWGAWVNKGQKIYSE